MKRILPFIIMAILTTGFTWGKSSADKCDEAKQLAYGLTSPTARSITRCRPSPPSPSC